MKVSIDDIFKFYKTRIDCHVKAVNYFAGLLGYSFPEHDGDKISEPTRTGYAYIFYNKYHPELHLMDEYFELCDDVKRTHHKYAAHHISHYDNVSEIPDIEIYEMVSDWASASFEQINVLKDTNTPALKDWFEINLAHLPWTKHQIELISKSFEIIQNNTDTKKLESIWQDLTDLI